MYLSKLKLKWPHVTCVKQRFREIDRPDCVGTLRRCTPTPQRCFPHGTVLLALHGSHARPFHKVGAMLSCYHHRQFILRDCEFARNHHHSFILCLWIWKTHRHAIIILWFRQTHRHDIIILWFRVNFRQTRRHAIIISYWATNHRKVNRKSIPPKRRFWKEEQKMKSGFRRKHFSRAWVLDLGY